MLKIFLSSTYQDLGEARSEILKKLDSAFAGVDMEEFIPDGKSSHEICINELKKSDIVIFLLSSNYGSLIDVCKLKENCKAECPMKTGEGKGYQISYTHCEYKTTIAEGILRQTYKVLKGWDTQDRKEVKQFEEEFGKEIWTRITNIDDPKVIPLICNNLAAKIVEWHTHDKLNFKKFVDREEVLNKIIDNIDSKVEVWGVGGVGKTALIQVALLVQKLKGRKILTIGTTKTYTSGSGLEYFSNKRADDQFITGSRDKITIYDVINAFAENGLLLNAEEVDKLPKDKQIEVLSQKIRSEKDLILFIDDFHLATEDVVNMAKSVDHLILSSRKNTHIARKEFYLGGIDEEDRENLIKLFSTEIPEKVRKLINKIAEGHPVSTELLVMNYEYIDFDKIKDFDLTDLTDDNQVKEFYNRVIEEIFSTNPQALTLLKDLAVLNTDLPTNVNKESVLIAYRTENIRRIFNSLVDTGMLKKRGGKEGTYEFYFKHIQDVLEDSAVQENHKKAIEYCEKKEEIIGENIDDAVEILYHKVKSIPNQYLVDSFLTIFNKIQPVHYGFKRLITIGEELKNSLDNEDRATIQNSLGVLYKNLGRFAEAEIAYTEALDIKKVLAATNPEVYLPAVAKTQNNLGILYKNLGRFEEAETAFTEALDIKKVLAATNPDAYLPDVADTQNNLGVLYDNLGRFEEAETAYQEALDIKKVLAATNPDAYLLDVADTQNNFGVLYNNLGRFEEAETAFTEALDIYKELADKNPDAYLPNVAGAQNNLGMLYTDLGRFEEAETAYHEALDIYKELADKNPDAYLPDVAMTQNNLGVLYRNLQRFAEAETTYQEALDIYKELADKNPDAYLPRVADTQNNLGNLYTDLGRFEEAETAFTEALDTYKVLAATNPDAYLPYVATAQNNLGVLYDDLGRFAEAETTYQEALDIKKVLAATNPDAYLPAVAKTQNNFGVLYNNLGRFEEAETAFTEALDTYKVLAATNPDAYLPYVAKAQNNLGVLYDNLGRFEEAIESYSELLKIEPNYVEGWVSMATFFNELERFEEAIKSYDKALEIEPNDTEVWIKKALLLISTENFGEAISSFDKVLELDPEIKSVIYWYYRGSALGYLNRYAEAILCYDKVLEVDSEYKDAWAQKGYYLHILQRYNDAIECYDKVLEIDINNSNAWYNKACLESLRMNKEKSIEFLKKAIELDDHFKNSAKDDEDFNNIRDSNEFRELIGE